MKLLAFTDIHGSLLALRKVEQKARTQKPDLIICTGDLTIFETNIISIAKRLNNLNKKIILIHGNHEDASTLTKISKLFKNIIFIHKNHFIQDNVLFLGYGGGGFAITDKKFENITKKFKKIIKNNQDKKIILVTHAPPYKTNVDYLAGSHCGNKSIRHFVENNNINLVICGHLHENFGKEDTIRKTKIINPGPFGKLIEV